MFSISLLLCCLYVVSCAVPDCFPEAVVKAQWPELLNWNLKRPMPLHGMIFVLISFPTNRAQSSSKLHQEAFGVHGGFSG